MFPREVLSLGLPLVLVGVAIWLAVRLLLRSLAAGDAPAPLPGLPEAGEAILVLSSGRLVQLNQRARQLFALPEGETPGLDRLARRLRPTEEFLAACAGGQPARLALDGRLVECSAVRVGAPALTVVTLREPELPEAGHAGRELVALNTAMTASLELPATVAAIMDSVTRLVAVDWVQVCLWDEAAQSLQPYFRDETGERRLETPLQAIRAGQGSAGLLAKNGQSVLLSEMSADAPENPRPGVLRSYLGLPLEREGRLIGTLELASLVSGALRPQDLDAVGLLAGQAAIALSNARSFADRQKRLGELDGLAQLSQAFGSARDPHTLFTRLVESILPLLPVEIVGFLLYNENQRMLESQSPFHGLPEQFLDMYRLPVPQGSPLERALIERDVLLTENAAEDPRWEALGLGAMGRGASLRETALIPLHSGGRMLGYFQVSNPVNRSGFSVQDLHLMVLIANQAAPVIDNLMLIQQQRLRAQRAEALRRIASLAGSAANFDEILKYSLQELAHLLDADVAAIFLLPPGGNELRLHESSLFGALGALPEALGRLRADDPQFHFTVSGSLRTLATGSLSLEPAVIPFYQAIQNFWKIESLVAVPLIIRDEGIGELWLGALGVQAFDAGSQQLAVTAAGQLAGVVEQSYLVAQTDESMRRRIEHLNVLAHLTRERNAAADLPYMLNRVLEEAQSVTGADCGSLRIFDLDHPAAGEPRTRLSAGEAPPEALDSLEKRAWQEGQPALAAAPGDISGTHPGVQSALVAPLLHQGKVVGLLSLHARTPARFDADDVEIAALLAAQVGALAQPAPTVVEGAARQEREAFGQLLDAIRAQPELPAALQAVLAAIRSATPFQMAVASLYDPRDGSLERVAASGLPDAAWRELYGRRQPWAAIQSLCLPEFRAGAAYFLPADRQPRDPVGLHTVQADTGRQPLEPVGAEAWHPDDLLLLPLLDAQGAPLGLLSLDAPTDGRRPDWQSLQTLDFIARQAGLAVQTLRQAARLRADAEQAQTELVRLQTIAEDLPGQIDRAALERVERLQRGLAAAVEANQQADAPAMLRVLASRLLEHFHLTCAITALEQAGQVRLLDVLGEVDPAANPEAFFGQRNPLRQAMQEGRILVLADVASAPEWRNCALLERLGARGCIALPLGQAPHRAGLLLVGDQPLDDELLRSGGQTAQILEQVAGQVALGLQNLTLLTETRRRLQDMDILVEFSRRLGALDADAILQTLVQSALHILPAAQAGWAGLWDAAAGQLAVRAALGYSDNDAMRDLMLAPPEETGQAPALPLRALLAEGDTPAVLRVPEVQFASDYPLPPEGLLLYRRATDGRLPVATLICPIQSGSHRFGVLVLESFSAPEPFAEADEALTLSLAQQAALALENAHLLRTAERRAAQLGALTQTAGAISSSLRSDDLIAGLLDQLQSILPYDSASLWLRSGSELMVSAARGFEDDRSLLGVTVSVEDSQLFHEMASTGQPIFVPDVREDPRFPSLTEPERISWLGIPLVAKGQLLGILALDKVESDFYTSDQIQAATTFAGQAAVALENARLYEESERRAVELDQRSNRLALLNRLSTELSTSLDTGDILRHTCQELLSALGVDRVAAVLIDEQDRYYLEEEQPAGPDELPLLLPVTPLFGHLFESRGMFQTAALAQETALAPLYREYFERRGIGSLLVVPLLTGGNLHGWMLLQIAADYRFSPQEMELARTIAYQAAAVIQNARLFAETRRLTQDLERRVRERTSEVTREHHNSQTLLHVITELSASLDMGLVLNRTLGVLNTSLESEQSILLLTQSERVYQAGRDLVGLKNNAANRSFRFEQELSRWVLRHRETTLVEDAWVDPRWAPPQEPERYRSALGVPLVLGEITMGTLVLLSSKPAAFSKDQVQLVEAAARQISIALNNADLFNLIRDQAEHLGGLLREQQVESSRSRAILEAVADGVMVTDATSRIYLFNASAERILGLPAEHVMGKHLDQYSGLFGHATAAWLETIRAWSVNGVFPALELYSQRLELDNGKVVEVHLAPVFMRSEYLGTVSIFRDITHEVQVDRLKTEFVANVSHELRTPMTSIKGYVDIMLMGAAGPIDERQARFLQIVKSNTERLSILVNDLLDVSKIELGRVILSYELLDLNRIAGEVLAEFQRRSLAEERPITFQLEVATGLPRVEGDLERVRQIISNLVSNGYNYTPTGGRVMVRIHSSGDEVQVDVLDTGIGIALADQDRIFERFYRGDDALVLASAGTGLGLAITRSLVEMHGGRMWFASTGVRGEGSVFSFTLPIYRPMKGEG